MDRLTLNPTRIADTTETINYLALVRKIASDTDSIVNRAFIPVKQTPSQAAFYSAVEEATRARR